MSNESNSNESAPPEKLLIDDPTNFQFHVAYLAYSEIYDKTADLEAKKQLNQHILALKQNQIDYSTFYGNINRYRNAGPSHHYSRALIKTQKKREWRRNAQKREREKRHGR